MKKTRVFDSLAVIEGVTKTYFFIFSSRFITRNLDFSVLWHRVALCLGAEGMKETVRKKREGEEVGATSSLCVPNIAATPLSTRELNYCMFLFIKCVFVSFLCHSEDRASILVVYTHDNPEKLHILKKPLRLFTRRKLARALILCRIKLLYKSRQNKIGPCKSMKCVKSVCIWNVSTWRSHI